MSELIAERRAGPLSGLRILDLTRLLPGPVAWRLSISAKGI